MKRLISLILILTVTVGMLLSLASCGGGDSNNPKASDPVALPLANWNDALAEVSYVDSHTVTRTVEITHSLAGATASKSVVNVTTFAGRLRGNIEERNVFTVTEGGQTVTGSYGYRDGFCYYSGADESFKSQVGYEEYLAHVGVKIDLSVMKFTKASMIYKRDGAREIHLSHATGDLSLFDGMLAELSALAGKEIRLSDVRVVATVGKVLGTSDRYPITLIVTPIFEAEGVDLPTASIRLDFSNIAMTSVERTDDFDGMPVRDNEFPPRPSF